LNRDESRAAQRDAGTKPAELNSSMKILVQLAPRSSRLRLPACRRAGRRPSRHRDRLPHRQSSSGCERRYRERGARWTEPERYSDWPEIDSAVVSPGYFRTINSVPLLQGRDFDWNDTKESPDVVIVNETAARRFWPGESPMGKRIARGSGASRKYAEIIAVVRDTKVRTLDEEARPHVYWPFAQEYSPMMYVLARTRGIPEPPKVCVRSGRGVPGRVHAGSRRASCRPHGTRESHPFRRSGAAATGPAYR
jgi:hypothetical protein